MRILMLDIDTLRPDHMSCYGYNRATTPNLDAVCRDGVRFDRYYCSDAPCLPSRAALISGCSASERSGRPRRDGSGSPSDGKGSRFPRCGGRPEFSQHLPPCRAAYRLGEHLRGAPLLLVVQCRLPRVLQRRRLRAGIGRRGTACRARLAEPARGGGQLVPSRPFLGSAYAVPCAGFLRKSL